MVKARENGSWVEQIMLERELWKLIQKTKLVSIQMCNLYLTIHQIWSMDIEYNLLIKSEIRMHFTLLKLESIN